MTYVMDSERRANAAGFGPSRFRSKPCRNAAVGLCQIPLGYIHAAAPMSARQTKALSIKWTKRSFWRYKEFFVTKSPFGKFPVSCSFVGNRVGRGMAKILRHEADNVY